MDWVMALFGLGFLVAPFVLNYSVNPTALWTSIIIGFIVMIVSGYEALLEKKQRWEYWTAGILGVIAIIAPFVFSFSQEVNALWTSIVAGVFIVLIAGAALTTRHFKTT